MSRGPGYRFSLLVDHGLESQAEFGYFVSVSRSRSLEDFAAGAEVTVGLTPLDLLGEGVDHPEKPK